MRKVNRYWRLDGRPKIAFTNAGSLSADQIRLYLRELDGKSNVGIAISGGNGDRQQKVWLAPDRLLAVGHVEIASPQFTGRAQSLAATFHLRPAVGANSGKPDKSASSSNATSTTSSTNSTKTEAKSSFNVAPASAQPQPRYYIDTDEIQLDVSMSGQSAVPTALACNGHVLLREIPLEAADQQPLEIRGGQLLVDHLETKSPHATLHGIAPGQAPGTALAQLAGRGVTMLVDTVEVDQGENRMWSKGPGKATLLMARDLAGNPSTSPIPLELTWQGGVKFDGQTMTFQRDVSIDGADTKVNCDELSAKLAAPIKVGQHVGQSVTSPSEIECRGRVSIENVQRDAGGLTSHEQIQLARLLINQQTGAIRGDGPGVIRATQFGSGMAAISGQPVASQQAAVSPLNPAGNKLYFLRVDFHQGLEGNIYTREVTFHERVRSIYGPVDSWEQELDPSRPETLPPDTITLTSEHLRLNEDPVAARAMAAANGTGKRPMGPIQMQAQEDVRITGQVPNQGEFSVEADRASYDRSKDVFILEGDGRTPAKLWRRTATGMDAPPVEARKLMYFRSRNDFKIDSLQYLEITPSDLQNARRPTPVR